MPEVQEVFRMATQKIRPAPGALDRQFEGQRRRSARRKAAAVGLVAALAVVAGVVAIEASREDPTGGGTVPAATGAVPPVIELEGYGGGFSSDGTRMFATGEGGVGNVYDTATGNLLESVNDWQHGDEVVAFSPNGSRFTTVVGDPACCDTYVYDTATGVELAHVGNACCYGLFSPDGSRLAVPYFPGGDRAHTQVVDALTGETVNRFPLLGNFAFSPDGQRIAVGSDEEGIVARVFDLGGRVEREAAVTLRGDEGEFLVTQLAWSPDGSTLVTTIANREVKVWDAVTGDLRFTIQSPSGRFTSVAFGSDPTRLATGSDDGSAIVWVLSSDGAREVATEQYEMRNQDWLTVYLSPDGTRLMAATLRGTTVWDLSS